MKKLTPLLLLFATFAFATTYTTNYDLAKPNDGNESWGSLLRDNFDTIDTQMKVNENSISGHVADTVGAHAASAISSTPGSTFCTSSTDVQNFLTCIANQLGSIVAGGVVTVADPQTITGQKTFTSEIIASGGIQTSTITNSGTLTLPTGPETIVGRATTDTLTNKTISGSQNTFSDIGDGSLATEYIKADGTRGLTGNWDAGAFSITASNINGTITGTNTGDITLGTVGSTPAAAGASLSGQVLTLQPADLTNGGVVSTGAQTFGGVKTFNGDVIIDGHIDFETTANGSLSGSNARIPQHNKSAIRFTNSGLVSIGSGNITGVNDGEFLIITNDTGNTITVINNYVSAAAGEAIFTGTGGDLDILNKGSISLKYDGNANAWLAISGGIVDLSGSAVKGTLPKARGGTGYDLTTQPIELPEISTPSTPASGFGRAYFKSDGKLYQLNDAGIETQVGAGGGGGVNFVTLDTAANSWASTKQTNADIETTIGDWVAYADAAATTPVDGTGGSPNTTFLRTTTNEINGTASAEMVISSGASRQGEGASLVVNVPTAYRGRSLELTFPYSVSSGTLSEGDIVLFAYDVTNSAFLQISNLNGIFNSKGIARSVIGTLSTTEQVRVIIHIARTATGAVTLQVDDIALNPYLLGAVGQASVYATARQLGASGCAYSESTSSGLTNYIDLGTGSGCNAWTTTGPITPVGTNDHRQTLTNLPAGQYFINITGAFESSAAGICTYRLSDGTNTYGNQSLYIGSTAGGTPALSFIVPYTSSQASVTWKIQASDNHGGACNFANNGTNTEANWIIKRFPSSNEQAARLDTLTWIVDANISGANPNLGTSAVTSYTGITNGSLTLTNNSVPGAISAQIACATTVESSGTTCSGDESFGLSFPVPSSGLVEACAEFTVSTQIDAADSLEAYFQIVETPNAAQTISQEGKSRVGYRCDVASSASSCVQTVNLCSTLNLQQGKRTLRVFYEQGIVNTPVNSFILADAASTAGQRDIHWTIKPLTYGAGTAVGLMTGTITSNTSGTERMERLRFTNSGTPTIATQSGSWVTSLTDGGAGITTLVIASGIFSAAPTCVCSVSLNGGGLICKIDGTPTATSVQVRTYSEAAGTATLSDLDANVICMGPR